VRIEWNGNEAVGKIGMGIKPDYGNGMGLEWKRSDGNGRVYWNQNIIPAQL